MKKRYLYMAAAVVLAGGLLAGCSQKQEKTAAVAEAVDEQEEEGSVLGGNIGISFPSEKNREEKAEAEEIRKGLEDLGYQVQVAYAGNDGKKQAEQIEQMVKDKVNCLIILPINSGKLQNVMKQADKQGIVTVAYDNLITGTDKLSYYVGFDDKSSGEAIGAYLEETLELDKAEKEGNSYTIEFFMGALNDRNSALQLEGIKDKLEKYLKKDILRCKSLRLTYEDASIARASEEIGAKTCENILQANYMDEPLDIICAGEDKLIPGILSSLKEVGTEGKDIPIITGVGSDAEAFRRIDSEKQQVQIYEYRSQLPALCVELIDKEIQGEEMKDMGTCDNGTEKIPALWGETELVTKGNYSSIVEEEEIRLIKEYPGEDDEQ